MATTVNTPVRAYAAAPGNARLAGSGFWTATVQCTQAWQVEIPVGAAWATHSSDATINVYRTFDGGTNWETLPFMSFSIDRVNNGNNSKVIVLPNGQYVLSMCGGGGSDTCSMAVLTLNYITAIQNV